MYTLKSYDNTKKELIEMVKFRKAQTEIEKQNEKSVVQKKIKEFDTENT